MRHLRESVKRRRDILGRISRLPLLPTSPIAETVLSKPRLAIRVGFVGKAKSPSAPGEKEEPRDERWAARASLLEDRVAEVLQAHREEEVLGAAAQPRVRRKSIRRTTLA